MTEDSFSFSGDENNLNPYKLITRRIDSGKIRSKKKREVYVDITPASKLSVVEDKPYRCGVIIYVQQNGETYFCLGIDTQSKNLTDFGGGVKKEETFLEGGLRELDEESQGVFGKINPEHIKNNIAVHCHNMGIIFIQMNVDMDEIVQEFNRRVQYNEAPEVSGIVWLSTEKFLESIHCRGQKLYIRVRRLLGKVTNLIKNM